MTTAKPTPKGAPAVPAVGIPLDRTVRPLRVMWVVETLDETQWRATEWIGATRDRARDRAKEWRADTTAPVRVVKYIPEA